MVAAAPSSGCLTTTRLVVCASSSCVVVSNVVNQAFWGFSLVWRVVFWVFCGLFTFCFSFLLKTQEACEKKILSKNIKEFPRRFSFSMRRLGCSNAAHSTFTKKEKSLSFTLFAMFKKNKENWSGSSLCLLLQPAFLTLKITNKYFITKLQLQNSVSFKFQFNPISS